ncbi:MAG: hypothetical protein IT430_12560 [Phycisphaerales bacterium]|nr:hypothetical protein [Phycisphaerales bacterium]
MPIVPLPRFEAEADPKARGLSDEEISAYQRLAPPDTVVVKYGQMGFIGEFPARLDRVPGCGTKFVLKTPRGTEIGEMLTTTCSNGGCGKSLTRREMLEYIENSGGRQYPFTTSGRVLRIAAVEDLQHMEQLRDLKRPMLKRVREIVAEFSLPMKIVDIEPILGEEVLTVYFMSENRIDFRDLVHRLSEEFHSRVEMRQVGAREEARLTADYERCGQHCCCQQFLKVLKPVSMKSAKVQKGTLDPLKISGRCGRLMCCLRYEDQTYAELKKNLPHRKTRVGTPDGPGIVMDSQILTQLVLVQLESDGSRVAVPVEQLCDPDAIPVRPPEPREAEVQRRPRGPRERTDSADEALRGLGADEVARRLSAGSDESGGDQPLPRQRKHRARDQRGRGAERPPASAADAPAQPGQTPPPGEVFGETPGRRRRRGRRRSSQGEPAAPQGAAPEGAQRPEGSAGNDAGDAGGQKRKRRRRGGRKRKRRGSEGDAPPPADPG